MRDKTYQIAISGITVAIGTIFLLLATYLPVANLGMLACATVALFLPFSLNFLGAGVLCYLATGLLSFFIGGQTSVIAYAAFFGLQPILIYLFKRFKLRLVLRIIISAAFAALIIFLFVKFAVLLELLSFEFELWIAELIGIPFFVGYEYLMERVYDQVGRLAHRVSRR